MFACQYLRGRSCSCVRSSKSGHLEVAVTHPSVKLPSAYVSPISGRSTTVSFTPPPLPPWAPLPSVPAVPPGTTPTVVSVALGVVLPRLKWALAAEPTDPTDRLAAFVLSLIRARNDARPELLVVPAALRATSGNDCEGSATDRWSGPGLLLA